MSVLIYYAVGCVVGCLLTLLVEYICGLKSKLKQREEELNTIKENQKHFELK